MSKTRTKKAAAKPARGGARAGSGRKQLYGEPLTEAFTARVNDEQGAAIGSWCRAAKVSPATLLREVALSLAGAVALGLGLDKLAGTASKDVELVGAAVFPVKCTVRQAAAIRAFCAAKKVAPGTWLREAALEHIGRAELGMRGAAAMMDRAL